MTSISRKFNLPDRSYEWRYFLGRLSWRSLIYAAAIIIALISVFPFLWTISTSLKQGEQILALPPRLIPDPIFWQNYKAVFEGFGGLLPVDKWLINSLFLTG